jgi:hypothetical protein
MSYHFPSSFENPSRKLRDETPPKRQKKMSFRELKTATIAAGTVGWLDLRPEGQRNETSLETFPAILA